MIIADLTRCGTSDTIENCHLNSEFQRFINKMKHLGGEMLLHSVKYCKWATHNVHICKIFATVHLILTTRNICADHHENRHPG